MGVDIFIKDTAVQCVPIECIKIDWSQGVPRGPSKQRQSPSPLPWLQITSPWFLDSLVAQILMMVATSTLHQPEKSRGFWLKAASNFGSVRIARGRAQAACAVPWHDFFHEIQWGSIRWSPLKCMVCECPTASQHLHGNHRKSYKVWGKWVNIIYK